MCAKSPCWFFTIFMRNSCYTPYSSSMQNLTYSAGIMTVEMMVNSPFMCHTGFCQDSKRDNQEPGGSTLMRMSRREETFMKRNLFWGSETFCYDGSMAEFILLTSMVSGCDIEHHLVHKGAVQRALLNQTLTCIAGTTSEETTVYKQSDTTKVYWVKKKCESPNAPTWNKKSWWK